MSIYTKYFLILIFELSTINIFAQQANIVPKINITPLHIFFQNKSDSTILFERVNYHINKPEYFIVSKVGDTISIYQYQQLKEIDKRILLPKAVGREFYKRNKLVIYMKQ